MKNKSLVRTKKLARDRLLREIHELNLEVSAMRDIIRMKQLMLRQMNQDIYRRSRASRFLSVVPGAARGVDEPLVCDGGKEEDVLPALNCLQGGLDPS
ncbi:MAG TPA: hypothetical protein DD979_08790 [Gammaproteobacteria bacterium]|jgi:hypothetical protein|nr:hypothetical protein [Gammaproteobacteria bacterium]